MKKKILICLCLTLLMTGGGCSSNIPKDKDTPGGKDNSAAADKPEETGSAGNETDDKSSEQVKTGLGVITLADDSQNAGDGDGTVSVQASAAAVAVDSKGVITGCIFDELQVKVPFSKDGRIIADKDMDILTKNQLGDEYGMKQASGIGKEWYEQADAFARYVTGKTLEEVKGIKVSEEGRAQEEDLAASVTISIGGLITVLEKAVENAESLGAEKGDLLGIWVDSSIDNSLDASEEDGVAALESLYTAITVKRKPGAEDKLTSCIIDGTQANIYFNKNGQITSNLKEEIKTKNELKDEYGMKAVSGIKKEWYEQAGAFSAYVTGKTKDEIDRIETKDDRAEDVDLRASVTIKIEDFMDNIEDAMEHIK